MHMVRTNYEAWCSQQYSEYVWLTINWWIWENPPTSKLDLKIDAWHFHRQKPRNWKRRTNGTKSLRTDRKKDRNRFWFPFYGEKEIWNTSSLLVGWTILEIVPCRNKVRVESSGDNRNIHWICVSNIMQYTYIYIHCCDFCMCLAWVFYTTS